MTKEISDIEIALSRLAKLSGVELEHGWLKALAHKMGLDASVFTGWIKRGECSTRGLLKIRAAGYPIEHWLVTHPPYEQPPEHMLPQARGGPQRDPDHGSYGIPDLEDHRVVTVIGPGDDVYLQKVREILSSNESTTVAALKANIDQFHEKIQDRKAIMYEREARMQDREAMRKMEERIKTLEKANRSLKNDNDSSHEDPANEMECAE